MQSSFDPTATKKIKKIINKNQFSGFDTDNIMRFLQQNADPNVKNDNGDSLLTFLVNHGKDPHARTLIHHYQPDQIETFKTKASEIIKKNELKKDKLLGSGSYSEVFSGVLYSYREVAMKYCFLKDDELLGQEKTTLKSFQHEIQILTKLNEEDAANVVKFKGYYIGLNEQVIVMDLVEGKTLEHYIVMNPEAIFSWDIRATIFQGLIEGLDYIFRKGVIHGDIKTSNIIIRVINDLNVPRYVPVYIDFGLSLFVGEHYDRARGTPVNLAPELFTSSQNSLASDIYSLGIVLQELTALRDFNVQLGKIEIKDMITLSAFLQANKRPFTPAKNGNFEKELVIRSDGRGVGDGCASWGGWGGWAVQ